jgi:hypothetical protein
MIVRRNALARIMSSAIVFPLLGCASEKNRQFGGGEYADARAADKWMQSWIGNATQKDPSASKAPNGALHVGRFADPVYYLTSVIGWDPEPKDYNVFQSVRVPIGFVTDFASIPRAFWSILRPDGLYSYAAVIHDFLYWEQYLSREDSDAILKLCMEDFRINSGTISTVYQGVRLGGGFAWDSNAQLKAAGERRILKKTPDDPTVRWEEWKSLPGVFKGDS